MCACKGNGSVVFVYLQINKETMKQSLVEILHRIISKSQGARLRAITGIEEHSCRKKNVSKN